MLFLSYFFYMVLTAFVVLRLFKEIRISRYVINFFISTTALNIIVVQMLHFFRGLDNSILYLIIQSVICLLSVILLIDPKKKIFKSPLPRFRIVVEPPTLIEGFLILLIFFILGLTFYVGTLSPINNSDSLHTHLPRIFYWLQHGSLRNWIPTAVTQISYPINISLQGLWLFLLTGSEKFFFLTTWLALAAIAALVYEISLLIGADKKSALTAVFVSLSFPVVLLQTYSYQGDAFVAGLVLCCIYFLLLYHKNNHKADLYLSLLALMVALGSKQTAFLFLPVYVLALVMLMRRFRTWRDLLSLGLLAVVFFGFFSSFKIIQNRAETGVKGVHMINPGYYGQLLAVTQKPFEGYLVNSLRYLYQAVNLDGLYGQTKLNLESEKEKIFRKLTEKLGVDLETRQYLPEYEEGYFKYDLDWPVSEDGSWFGPLSFTILPVAMIITLFQKKYTTRKYYLLLSFILLLGFIFGQVILKGDGWGAYRGRHMTIAVLSLAPLISSLIPHRRIPGMIVSLFISFIAFYLSLSVLLINDNRPIITTRSLYSFHEKNIATIKVSNFFTAQYVSRSEKLIDALLLTSPDRQNIIRGNYYERLFFQDTGKIELIEFVNKNIKSEQDLYLLIEPSLLEYALFGINRTRNLFPIETFQELPPGECALVSDGYSQTVPSSNKKLDQKDGLSIYCIP